MLVVVSIASDRGAQQNAWDPVVLQQILELIAQLIGFVFLLLVVSIASDRGGHQNATLKGPLQGTKFLKLAPRETKWSVCSI